MKDDEPEVRKPAAKTVMMFKDLPLSTPLYTTPPRREWVGLTEEEVIDHYQTNVDTGSLLSFVTGARYAEAKLRERNQ